MVWFVINNDITLSIINAAEKLVIYDAGKLGHFILSKLVCINDSIIYKPINYSTVIHEFIRQFL